MHISYEIISQMKCFCPLPLQKRLVGGPGEVPGTLYLFAHISNENTHQHFAFLHAFQFHMKYMPIGQTVSQAPFTFPQISYEILF
jgi:hypothetical protein